MNAVFDLKKLSDLLRDFYAIAGVRITVFDRDLVEIAAYPADVAPLCRLVRGVESGRAACARCDREACARACAEKDTVIYRCHAGLTEAVTPLFAEQRIMGYLLIGHAFAYESHEVGWQAVRACCRDLPLDEDVLRAACEMSPLLERDYIRAAAQIMHAVASYLVLERLAILQEDPLSARLNELVQARYAEPVSIAELCAELGVGRTQLYKLSRQLYGRGIAEELRALRLEKAKKTLLEAPDRSIAEVAEACGFGDYNYFIAVFSREVGCSPGRWRREYGGS